MFIEHTSVYKLIIIVLVNKTQLLSIVGLLHEYFSLKTVFYEQPHTIEWSYEPVVQL